LPPKETDVARPLSYDRTVKVRLTDAQVTALRWRADALGTSTAEIIRALIEQHLNPTIDKEAAHG
jgi:hypothetical protein